MIFEPDGEKMINELRTGMYFKRKYDDVATVMALVVNKLMRTGFDGNVYSLSVEIVESDDEEFFHVGKKMFMEFSLYNGKFTTVKTYKNLSDRNPYYHLFKSPKNKQ